MNRASTQTALSRRLSIGKILRSQPVVAALALGICGPVLAQSNNQARTPAGFVDPVQIDLAVEIFTGKPAGVIGGARSAADRRLRLAQCSRPLTASWHGNRQRSVRVACEGSSPWHMFVAIRAAPTTAQSAKPAKVIRRGDTVTIAIKGQGFTVRRPGEAQQAGAIGDWISVRTSRKAEPISAQIIRPGLVVIPF